MPGCREQGIAEPALPFPFQERGGKPRGPAARDTAINPAVLSAFALVICGAEGPPAYPGIAGHEPDLPPDVGSYVSESNFFEADRARAYWDPNYPRLLTVKDTYDPDGLFLVHHGVGSERWSADGFTRLA